MNLESAYTILDTISVKENLNETDISQIIELTHHEEAEIRAYAAEILVCGGTKNGEEALIRLCKDKDELVRVNACDSLSAYADEPAYEALLYSALHDDSVLVKEYALLSLGDMAGKTAIDESGLRKVFIKLSEKQNLRIAAACFRGLCLLGETSHLQDLLQLFKCADYQEQCTMIRMLEDVITPSTQASVIQALTNLQKSKLDSVVISEIDRLLEKLKHKNS